MEGSNEEDSMIDTAMEIQQSGGGNDKSFVDYMTTFSGTEKGQLMNLAQYCGIAIIPLLAVLKLMKMYMPISNPLKPTSELIIEVIVQLVVILVAFFLIHKFVLYFPTYSQMKYDGISLLSGMLPLLFLMFTLDTKISEKLNVLFDRLLGMMGLIKEPYGHDEPESGNEPNEPQRTHVLEPPQSTVREPVQTTSIEALSGNMGNAAMGMGGSSFEPASNFEPLAANMF